MHEYDWKWIAKFEYIIYIHLHLVNAGLFEFHITEKVDTGVREFRFIKLEFQLVVAQLGGLVGCDDFNLLGEFPHARSPAVKADNLERRNWQLRHDQLAEDANENWIAVGFLAYFFAH